MGENETLGASFSIDVTNLKAGLAQANRLIRESESEFKAAAAGMDDWTESQAGLEARIKHLNTACEVQRKKVDALQGEYDRLVADGLDPTSAAAIKLRTDINKEKEALAKNEREIKKQTEALEDLENAAEDAADAERETGKAADDSAEGFTVAKGAIAGFIANGLTALVNAAKDAISTLASLAAETREYRSILASLDESSKLAGYSAEQTAQTYDHLYGVLGDAQAVATTTANLQAMGLEQGKLTQLTNGVIGAWAKYGDSIPIDGLSEAVNHTVQLGEVQGTLADVIEWGGGTVEGFNEKLAQCTTDTERANLIMDMMARQGLTNAGEAWQANNESIVNANKAQSENERITAQWGAKVEPITTKVREGFNKILSKLYELTEDVDMEAFGASIDKGFETFIDDILPKIMDGLDWIIDNKEIVVGAIAAMGAAFAVFKVASLIQSVTTAIQGMTVAQGALNVAMSSNPIGAVILAVTALIGVFALLWKYFDENPKRWAAFKETAAGVWRGIKTIFSDLPKFFSDVFGKAWAGVKKVFSVGGRIFDGIKEGIIKSFKAVVNAIITGINKVVRIPFEGLNKILDRINGLSIAGIEPFSWLTWRAPIPQLPKLATGGVVRKATTAIIGENGAEAVVPLERNTQWIKKVAAELAEQQPQSVVVHQTNHFAQTHSRLEMYKAKQQTAAAVRLALTGA